MKPAPAAVTSAPATAQSWRETLSAIGTVESYQGVTLRSEIEGRIVNIAFQSGAAVREGDVLVELEAATELAQLKSFEAAAKLAGASLERARDLRRTNTNTAVDLETAEAVHAQALAAVEGMKATLAKKRIVAPFSGRLGIRQVNIGQFLNKGDVIVSLEAIDPAYVDFALPQQDLPQLKSGLSVRVTIDAFPDRAFEGKIEAINPRVSDATRNVRVRAVVPNPDETLRPGLFANVSVLLPAEAAVLELPATAVVYSPYGNSVYVVVEKPLPDGSKQLIAEQRFVTTGAKRGDQVAIVKGLNAGDQVVTAGQMKLRNGSPITINNTVVPTNNPAPKPAQS
jgi:membrane fusion protein (multidrug efflux system)